MLKDVLLNRKFSEFNPLVKLTAIGERVLYMKKLVVTIACLSMLTIYSAAQEVPKAEFYAGYTFVRFYPNSGVQAFTANGGLGSFQYNFTRHFSFVAELGGVTNSRINVANFGSIQPNQTSFTYLFGPRLFFNKAGVVSPFIEYEVGGFHNSRSFNISNDLLTFPLPPLPGVGVTTYPTYTKFRSTQNAAAMAVGGGVDIRLSHLIGFRPIQLDYLPTHFSPFNVPGLGLGLNVNRTTWQNNLRYSTGVLFRLGGATPPPPTVACNVTPAELLPWAGPVQASVQTTNFNPNRTLDYSWSSTSGQIMGQGPEAKVDTANLSPGTYTISAHVSDPRRRTNGSASNTCEFTVKQPQAPQVACSATPSTVKPGEPITINIQGSSPDQSRIERRTVNSNAGTLKEGETVAGGQPGEFTTTATLDTTNVQPGPVNVSVAITDVHGLSASCVASANVAAPPEIASETLISDCDFNNPKKLARVDNECKAVLDEVALRLQHEPNGKLVVVGCAEEEEVAKVSGVDALRAANAKAYLTGGEAKQQIDVSRIEIRTSTTHDCGKKARLYFVPEGGTFTQQNTVIVDESTLPANKLGEPAATRPRR
jgi:hypothetical protein